MKYTTSGARSRGHPSPNLTLAAEGLHCLITDQQWLASRVIVRMLLLIIPARDKSPPKYCGSEGFDAIWPRAATQRCQLSTMVQQSRQPRVVSPASPQRNVGCCGEMMCADVMLITECYHQSGLGRSRMQVPPLGHSHGSGPSVGNCS